MDSVRLRPRVSVSEQVRFTVHRRVRKRVSVKVHVRASLNFGVGVKICVWVRVGCKVVVSVMFRERARFSER